MTFTNLAQNHMLNLLSILGTMRSPHGTQKHTIAKYAASAFKCRITRMHAMFCHGDIVNQSSSKIQGISALLRIFIIHTYSNYSKLWVVGLRNECNVLDIQDVHLWYHLITRLLESTTIYRLKMCCRLVWVICISQNYSICAQFCGPTMKNVTSSNTYENLDEC